MTDDRNGAKANRVRESGESQPDVEEANPSNRRSADRIDVTWSVDCTTDDTFLYAAITNISALGIFVRTHQPLEVGTALTLRFAPPDADEPFVVDGVVQWINPVRPLAMSPNPGMGIQFVNLTAEQRERLVDVVHTIAYVRESLN
ncbi:MAG: TIGR02266 family protein [Polyangiaceae bacterium]